LKRIVILGGASMLGHKLFQVSLAQGLAEYWRWVSQDTITLHQLERAP
jgi:hypothetical protein